MQGLSQISGISVSEPSATNTPVQLSDDRHTDHSPDVSPAIDAYFIQYSATWHFSS